MFNPFSIFGTIIIFIIFLYSLNLSYLYPPIMFTQSFTVVLLIALIFIFIGILYSKINIFRPIKISEEKPHFISFLLLIILYVVEFSIEGVVPIIEIIKGNNSFNYQEFGVPKLHVFIVSFNIFVSLVCFQGFLISKSNRTLVFFLISLLLPLIIYYRSMIILILISCLLIYLSNKNFRKVFNVKYFVLLFASLLFSANLFGIMGNIRINSQLMIEEPLSESTVILKVGQATDFWYDYPLYKPLFWTYLYATSPLANFQHNVINNDVNMNMTNFIEQNFIFDFLTENRVSPKLLTHSLNATFMLTGSYISLGWIGVLIYMIYILTLIFTILIFVSNKSYYFKSIISLLGCLLILGIFRNMFNYSPFSLAICIFILYVFIEKIRKLI